MELSPGQVRALRLHAHHLDKPLPADGLSHAAGACGFQNSPPGAWETAAFNRVEDCSVCSLHTALYHDRTLLQAWSWRGVPAVFPARDAGVFLSPLRPLPGEEPWIYTRGLSLALDMLGMEAGALLPLVEEAARLLEGETVYSKEALDRVLADGVRPLLPAAKRAMWDAPSPYGHPDRQTVGGAVVSFLLRPCATEGLVVFGERTGPTPSFTSPQRWLGGPLPAFAGDGDAELTRRFLHCYGPALPGDFDDWLGASPAQTARLWQALPREETVSVTVEGKARTMLAADLAAVGALPPAEGHGEGRLLLLGPHDPYLDLRDRALLLPDKKRQRAVWRTVANPGVILQDGCIAGIWKARTLRGGLALTLSPWEAPSASLTARLKELAEGYAAFRLMPLKSCVIHPPA